MKIFYSKMKNPILFLFFIVAVRAFPTPLNDEESIKVKNVIDAPVICPPGQQLDQNGRCREVWRIKDAQDDKNVIDAPVVCPPGQKPDNNGKCREEWLLSVDKNVIDAPIVCPPGQKPDQNGKCREEWSALLTIEASPPLIPSDKNVIDAPVVCPPGQKPDLNGKCREAWRFQQFQIIPRIFY